VGKSPEVTMGARLAALVKKGDKDNPLVRVKPGVFALREWDPATIEKGLEDRTPALERLAAQHPGEPDELDVGASSPHAASNGGGEDGDDEPILLDAAERERAELAAHANELFESEDDDDEPIFGSTAQESAVPGVEGGERALDGSGRRRRRRRRGRGRGDDRGGEGLRSDGLPSYTVSDAPLEGVEARSEVAAPEVDFEARRPPERERDRGDRFERDRGSERDRGMERDRGGERDRGMERDRGGERDRGMERDRGGERDRGDLATADDLSVRGMADGLAALLATFDRNRGPVALQTLVDAAQRRGRFFGDQAVGQGLLAAAARADNVRALARGERPRFRVSSGRIGLTEWALDGELVRIEGQIRDLSDRYREAARRSVLRLLQELPQRALGEVVMLVLEHVGFSELVPLRRPGVHGAELHLAGKLRTPAGEIRTAVVVRRDGREIGRERVTELRGALHHYGPAHAGWLLTTGQVLSGAREEAASPGAAPVTVIDGLGIVRLCEEHGVGVVRTVVSLMMPDLDLLDALRGA
jgi:hypothetical protein